MQPSREKCGLTPLGVFTTYTPFFGGSPGTWGITGGPDGNIWFTDVGTGVVWKATTAGAATPHYPPTTSSFPWNLTAGPDGNVWLTELDANKIAKVTSAAVFTEYTIPTASSRPWSITTGPDGNIWFTAQGTNKIGKLSLAVSSHDAADVYAWTAGPPYAENGTTFTNRLATLNAGGFGGASGWRLPTLTELQTVMLDFQCRGAIGTNRCICPSSPCAEAALGFTESGGYWSRTSYLPSTDSAWLVDFEFRPENDFAVLFVPSLHDVKQNGYHVRAVRAGF